MATQPIQFPLRLRCELEEFTVGDVITIRQMQPDDAPRLLGVKSVALDENGRLKSFTSEASPAFSLVELDQYDEFYSSNYVATVPSIDDARNLNLAIKLTASSCTALWIGISGDRSAKSHSRHFLSPPCYVGPEPLRLDQTSAGNLGAIVSDCRRLKGDKKFAVMADIFLYAMSVAPRRESRCIELSIILEMLLLPKASTELSYRFALRLAKLAAKELGESSQDWHSRGQKIYKTRSRLVHAGQDDKLQESARLIEETARVLLAMYARKPSLFDDAALDAMCIAA